MDWLLHALSGGAAPAFLSGVIIGGLICFTGVGGGVLVIPVLTFFFGLPVSIAVGTASAYTAITKVMAGVEHLRIRNVNVPLFLRLSAWALPGLLLSALTVNLLLHHFPAHGGTVQEALRLAVIFAIFLSLALILGDRRPPANANGEANAAAYSHAALAVAGISIGVVMGATGIGGGVLIAPALLLIARETPKRVVGTSIVTALVLSALTALLYSAGEQLDWRLALWMSAGSLVAIPLASRALRRAPERVVKKVLLLLIGIAVLLMLTGR